MFKRCLLLLASAALLGCAPQPLTPAPALNTAAPGEDGPDTAGEPADGPHAAADRPTAPLNVRTENGATISRFDFGNVNLSARPGEFAAPLRGLLVVPEGTQRNLRPIVIAHMRAPNCTGDIYQYPCPAGRQERRLDEGMLYLARALARQGYAALLPDLAPTYIATTPISDYPQIPAATEMITDLRDRLLAAAAGGPNPFGVPLAGRLNVAGGAALITHSRSGYLISPVAEAWANSALPLRAALAWEPAFDIHQPGETGPRWSPPPPDLPYLAVESLADQDAGLMAAELLSRYAAQPRKYPALTATVDGFGHSLFNAVLAAEGDDDRTDCDTRKCPDAAAHQAFLVNVAQSWLAAAFEGPSSTYPLQPADILPATLEGHAARWLALTNAPARVTLLPPDDGAQGSTTFSCRFFDVGDPEATGPQCPEAELGINVSTATWLRGIRWETDEAAHFSLTPAGHGALRELALQVMPMESRPAGQQQADVRVTLRDGKGHKRQLVISGRDAALRNRLNRQSNGVYLPSTVRVPLQPDSTAFDLADVQSIEVGGNGKPGGIYLRALDLVYTD